MTLKKALKKIFDKKRLSVAEVAQKAGVTRDAVYKLMETSGTTPGLEKVCEVVNVPTYKVLKLAKDLENDT